MAPSAVAQRRTHNLLLFQKLLNLRDGASPFTLVLDTLEQSARPLLEEFITRAKISKSKIVFISFQTLRKPKHVDTFIKARGKSLSVLRQEIATHVPTPQPGAAISNRTVLIIDSLHPLASTHASLLPTFLSDLLDPSTSLLAVYHLDIPLSDSHRENEYAPDPLTLITYLATAILKISSLPQTLEKKRARDRSLPEAGFGLSEEREGVIFGMDKFKGEGVGSIVADEGGVVVEMELRRRSGRGVREVFVLSTASKNTKLIGAPTLGRAGLSAKLCLLDDHPLYAPPTVGGPEGGTGDDEDGQGVGETTFNLGLTEKQRKDREGVVLPYFDAQNSEGVGEGGRILYEMDRGDDFDEEEDEI